jgi:adenylate cyclase
MLKDLETFNAEIEKEGIPAFGMGLGINTATVVVGNMGSDQRFDYTCLGDGVNLAARLEGQSKPYAVKLVIGPQTAELVRDVYQVVELDLLAVKGKTEPVKIFTIVEHFDTYSQIMHDTFLELYRKGEWIKAMNQAQQRKTEAWNGELVAYYDMMIERCTDMLQANVQNFDGIYRATSK